MTATLNLDDFYWVEIAPGRQRLFYKGKEGRSSKNNAPHVISDTMDAMRHPITGKLMDSKSEFRKVTRSHGCTEVGNEKMVSTNGAYVPSARGDISRVMDRLGWRE